MDPITPASSSLTGITPPSVATPGSVSTSASTSSGSPSPTPPTDQVQISIKGALTTKYVQEVRAVAPLDQQAINQLKAAISKGTYPPPSLIEGLINLVGATIPSTAASADPTAGSSSDAS